MAEDNKGVLAQHRDRMQDDPDYRASALTPTVSIRGKHLDTTAPTSLTAHADNHGDGAQVTAGHTERASDTTNPALVTATPTALTADEGTDSIDQLKGDALEQAAADADIEGRSTMTADEKRAALRDG